MLAKRPFSTNRALCVRPMTVCRSPIGTPSSGAAIGTWREHRLRSRSRWSSKDKRCI